LCKGKSDRKARRSMEGIRAKALGRAAEGTIYSMDSQTLSPQPNDDYDYSYYYCTVLCSTLHSHLAFSVPNPWFPPFRYVGCYSPRWERFSPDHAIPVLHPPITFVRRDGDHGPCVGIGWLLLIFLHGSLLLSFWSSPTLALLLPCLFILV
jgi:hypothetical protein